jgi:4-hydroxy-2-oxoglutarate aldolase
VLLKPGEFVFGSRFTRHAEKKESFDTMTTPLSGIIPALATPFDDRGALAVNRIRENIERYNRVGLSGYLANGSTGESVLLDRAEFEGSLAAVRESAAQGRILIAGTGVDSTAETISRTEVAAKLGYDYALVAPPYFFKPMMKSDLLVEHFRRVADASRIPVLLYSVPQFTGVAIEADVAARLSEHPNIAGMKDSSGNVDRVGTILSLVPASFQLMTGSSSTIYPTMVMGGRGAILALATFLPEICIEIYKAAAAGDSAKALEIQRRVIQPTQKIVGARGISGVKYAMDCRGYYGGPARRPLLPLQESEKKDIESLLAAFAPAVAAN